MRPLRLDLRGFAIFREHTVIDLTDADFFALVGPTGSGKSTILDAICFSLYGQVPRWSGKTVVNALAPSGIEAAVRMIFESGGRRYAVTRVVRRDGKGRVATKQAGLQLLPPTFNVAVLDGDEPVEELGQTLAGTPVELDAAVADVVGLPYDQFIKCVLLPQGEFAAFLHAKPAERQEILVKLLGLEVYEQIREKAAERDKAAAHQLSATERLLADLAAESDDGLLAAAQERVDAVEALAARVVAEAPGLSALDAQRRAAVEALAVVDGRLTALGRIAAPADAGALATAGQQAKARLAGVADELTAAEEHEEKARARLDATVDPADVKRTLDGLARLAALRARQGDGATALTQADKAHTASMRTVEQATKLAKGKADEVVHAQHALEEARNTDRVAVLRPLLQVGHACPVCEQSVATLPAQREVGATVAAQDRLKRVRAEAEKADRDRQTADDAARETDRRLASIRARKEQLDQEIAQLAEVLAGAPEEAELHAQLAAHAQAKQALDRAGAARRRAMEQQRAALAEVQRVDDRLRAAWRIFDTARDSVASVVPGGPVVAPPPVDREDLQAAWAGLAEWAKQAGQQLTALRTEADQAAREATASEETVLDRIRDWFDEAEVAMPREIAGLDRAVTVAVERAAAARDKILDARKRADDLRKQRKQIETERAVAATLAQHLKANNFEAWLLEEALDALVAGASEILRELSAGQYDLMHRNREFFVVDHHDAGLTRPVRTLSGGETFQASLALALSLADQLAGMAHAASLDSILLDEGFGTLDSSTLDVVAATLENLAARGDRMVGVVTHVAALAERIPVRFEVRKDARTARVDRIG
ncbi:exonuclease SbcC [Hamadaea flava]|uniref:Nuclease SbcCD subunit C n=1 Tax=Hamadaea flava TaxID=1742688 RepID=A0ABV8LYC1_9ACTN|nr:SMC family ATPase [Hamadaea flava]MCP2324659.1 exonuclease SbcC [Hamadaea flava]